MSDKFDIKAGESGLVRLFGVDIPVDAIDGFIERDASGHSDFMRALGSKKLDDTYAKVFALDDLEGLGLAGYLSEGLGVSDIDISQHLSLIEGMAGVVAVVASPAFAREAQTLVVKSPLRRVATLREDRAPVKFEPLPDASAQGQAPAPITGQWSDARIGGMVAMAALAVMALLVILMVVIA